MKRVQSCIFFACLTVASKFDPINLLEARRNTKSTTFEQAVDLLRGFQNSPSCYRTAAQLLVSSCQQLESNHGEQSGDELVYFRYNYALGLAVCDLTVAKKAMAPSCDAFQESALMTLPLAENGKHIQIPQQLTNDCMQALGSDAVLWNSFNSNKAQAMTICQASREDMEKDEILSTYRATGKVVESFNELLDLYAQEWRAENKQRETAHARLFQNFAAQLSTVKDDLSNLAKNILRDLRAPIKSAEDSIASITTKGTEVEALFILLRDDIQKVHGQHILAQRNTEAATYDMRESIRLLNTEMDRMGSYMNDISTQFANVQAHSIYAEESARVTTQALTVLQTRVTTVTDSMSAISNLTSDHRNGLKESADIISSLKSDASSIRLSIFGGGLHNIFTARLLGVPWWMYTLSAPLATIIGFTFYTVSLQRCFRFLGVGLLTPIAMTSALRASELLCQFSWNFNEISRRIFSTHDESKFFHENSERLLLFFVLLFTVYASWIIGKVIYFSLRRRFYNQRTCETDEEDIPYIKLEPED